VINRRSFETLTVAASRRPRQLMPMKSPSHPGRLIRADLEELNVSVAAAAEAMGVTRQQLYRVIRGQSGVSPDMALRLEMAVGGSADMWLRMQMNHDLARARLRRPKLKVRRLEAA
jgi:addiction module HigA family antidote